MNKYILKITTIIASLCLIPAISMAKGSKIDNNDDNHRVIGRVADDKLQVSPGGEVAEQPTN